MSLGIALRSSRRFVPLSLTIARASRSDPSPEEVASRRKNRLDWLLYLSIWDTLYPHAPPGAPDRSKNRGVRRDPGLDHRRLPHPTRNRKGGQGSIGRIASTSAGRPRPPCAGR